MQTTDVERDIYNFIVDNFLYGKPNGLSREESLLGRGVIDSTGVLELVTFVQDHFGISIEDDEVIPNNLDSVANLVNFVSRKSGIAA